MTFLSQGLSRCLRSFGALAIFGLGVALWAGCSFVDSPDEATDESASDLRRRRCGDRRCSGGETCVSCPADCGICPDAGGASSSSSSGGSSSGGVPSTDAGPPPPTDGPPNLLASSCAAEAVEAAIAAARDGDVVGVPAGRCEWSRGIRVGKGIHLRGVAKDTVTIVNNAGSATLLALEESAARSVEVSFLRVIEGSSTADAHVTVGGAGRPAKVHDNYFETNGKMLRSIRWTSRHGVAYRNEFYSNRQDDQAIVILGPSDSWTTADTMGMRDTSGESNVYIEDNVFRELYVQALDPDSNSRVVIRHNSFLFSGMASHGADTSEVGTRHWEIYENTFTFTNFGDCAGDKTPPLNWFFFIRGGTGVIADNVMPNIESCAWGNKPELNMTVMNLRRNAGPYPCWKTYPAPRQIGQSHDGRTTITDPVYIWGNSGGMNPTPSLSDYPNECGAGAPSTADFVRAGRDYVTGTARPGYQKYTYPHPLR